MFYVRRKNIISTGPDAKFSVQTAFHSDFRHLGPEKFITHSLKLFCLQISIKIDMILIL